MISSDKLKQFELVNSNGMKATITNYGAKLVSLYVLDQQGYMGDVVLGYDSLSDYLTGEKFFGAIVGRYANRIGKGQFMLNGQEYQLPINDGKNHLHGGDPGFESQVWNVLAVNSTAIILEYVSADGENGYPGTLITQVTYHLADDNALYITYVATTDSPTVVNLTHHSYFNLRDGGLSSIDDHELTIHGSRFTVVGDGLIPTGELASVSGTPFDFLTPHQIGERIDDPDSQIMLGRGYDHNYVLDRPADPDSLFLAASVYEPVSGRVMDVLTTEPGLQFYSGNFLDGSQVGKGKVPYQFRSAFCLEAQHFPDSPNRPEFPEVVLQPDESYRQMTVYRFFVRKNIV